jgi:hypothetical protein
MTMYGMYGLMEGEFATSPDQETFSNVVEIDSYRRVEETKRIAPAVLDWPAGVQVAWDLAH